MELEEASDKDFWPYWLAAHACFKDVQLHDAKVPFLIRLNISSFIMHLSIYQGDGITLGNKKVLKIWASSWDYGTFVLCKLILQKRMHSHPVGLDVWFLVGPFVSFHTFMYANSEGSGETARMRRLVWALVGRLCDKYHNLKSWLIWCIIPYAWVTPWMCLKVQMTKIYIPVSSLQI